MSMATSFVAHARRWQARRDVAYAAIALVAVMLAQVLGKDINWDQISYHYYAGFSALHDRLAQDFLPSGMQSYLVPWAHVPFYVLVSSGLSDRAVVAVLAFLAVPALWASWEIGGRLGALADTHGPAPRPARFAHAAAWWSVVLALLCTVYLQQLGTSFVDAPLAGLVLWGFVALIAGGVQEGGWRLALAAVLLGCSAALKATNALPAVAAALLVLLTGQLFWRDRIGRVVTFALLGLGSGLVVAGAWWWRLAPYFDNPVVPLASSNLSAAEGSAETFTLSRHMRFVPVDIADALLRPLWMLSPEWMIYTEPPAPDFRYLALFLLLALVPVCAGVRYVAQHAPRENVLRVNAGGAWGGLGAGDVLTAMYVACWAIWLYLSGNGRYLMPMALLLGPLVVYWTYRLGRSMRWRGYALGAITLTQCALLILGAQLRWEPVAWDSEGRWFAITVPDSLQREPALYLSIEAQPLPFLAPFLHPASSFASVAAWPLVPGEPVWERVETLFDRHHGRAKAVLPVSQGWSPSSNRSNRLDITTMSMGLRVDLSSCVIITDEMELLQTKDDINPQITSNRRDQRKENLLYKNYAACRIERDPELFAEFLRERHRADAVFEAVAHACPSLITTAVGPMAGGRQLWSRFDPSTDVKLILRENQVFLRRLHHREKLLGNIEDILLGSVAIDCGQQRKFLLNFDGLNSGR